MPKWVVWVFMEKLAPFLKVERPGVDDEDESDGLFFVFFLLS